MFYYSKFFSTKCFKISKNFLAETKENQVIILLLFCKCDNLNLI